MKMIPILSDRCLVVELPEGAPTPYVINTGRPHLSYLDIDVDLPEVDLPSGNWRIIGMLSEVTDDDLINIIDVLVSSKSGKCLFPNFTGGPWKTNRIESLDSAIKAQGYYLDKNPYAHNLRDAVDKAPGSDYASKLEEANIFRQAQTRVLDRSRCLLLGRESKTPEFMGFKIERK